MAILSGVSDVKPETKESPNTVQAALLLRDAAKLAGTVSKTVILTANGEISFIFGANNENALRFTVAQWNEIVEFADSQLLQKFEDEQDKRASCAQCGV